MSSALLAFAALDPRLATECRAMRLVRHERPVRIGIHDFERTGAQPVEISAPMAGLLAARHFPGLIQTGDCAAVVAVPMEAP